MRYFLRLLLLTLAAVSMAPFAAGANGFTYAILTKNESGNRAWITIQDLGKTRNLDYGWVDANSSRPWRTGGYLRGSYYFVRFEFMDKSGKRVCDTRGQTLIGAVGNDGVGSAVAGRYDPKTGKCYIQHLY
ncbi:MAG TPA: hypothetical protein VMG98_06950 [Verrucomicrobiae bacterium]|nr:hypothetical protein [Verrucomicrobiae bacterium]